MYNRIIATCLAILGLAMFSPREVSAQGVPGTGDCQICSFFYDPITDTHEPACIGQSTGAYVCHLDYTEGTCEEYFNFCTTNLFSESSLDFEQVACADIQGGSERAIAVGYAGADHSSAVVERLTNATDQFFLSPAE